MRRVTLVSSALLFSLSFASSILAADIAVKAPPAPIAACNWCGLYAGVHAGYGWSDVDASIAGFAITPTPSPKGAFGGVQLGYNWVVAPNWLVGVETDFSVGSIDDKITLFSAGPFSLDAKSELEYFGTARGRVGYLRNDWLFYGTGGLAWGRNQVSSTFNLAGILSVPVVDDHQYHFGWTAGGGVEWMFAPRWTVKAEYLYADLGAQDYPTVFTLLAPVKHEQTLQTLKLGVNYKF